MKSSLLDDLRRSAKAAAGGRSNLSKILPFEANIHRAHTVPVYRDIAVAPDQGRFADLAGNLAGRWLINDATQAVSRVQQFWASSINVLGQNLRFGAELMNPVINGAQNALQNILGAPPDPMARLTNIMSELTIARSAGQRPDGGLGR